MQFSRFTSTQIISDFSNYFYFNYSDQFIQKIKNIVSSNENLVSIKIISKRTNSIIFDSEKDLFRVTAEPPSTLVPLKTLQEIEEELKTKDQAGKVIHRQKEKLFSVHTLYRSEGGDPLFYLEYLFGYFSLNRNIELIKRQILVDLLPSLVLGLAVAFLLSQLLVAPIRKLVSALKNVTAGDFDVVLSARGSDEISELLSAFNQMTIELKKKKELRKFLSESTYRQVMEAKDLEEKTRTQGKKVTATILYADIRGFVNHCENLEAEEITSMLNDYFTQMVEVITKHGGEVDKFIGDGILAVFYALPEKRLFFEKDLKLLKETTIVQAIYCALEMQDKLSLYNQKRLEALKAKIDIGIGITHGEVISGPIGSKERMDFTVIGDVVNLASRIEKLSKGGKHTRIVFTKNVSSTLKDLMDFEEIHNVKILGKEEEIQVYELIKLKNLSELKGSISSSDFQMRQRSLELLGQSRNIDAISYVIGCISDVSEDVRFAAIGALGKLVSSDNSKIIDILFERLSIETSEKTVSVLISTLGKLCVDERILKLAPYLDSTQDRIVANTIEALGQVRIPECLDLLLPKLTSLNSRIKANAALALFTAGKIEVIEVLKTMLLHSQALMRSSAVFALGELTLIANKNNLLEVFKNHPGGLKMFLIELQQCVPLLVSLLRDSDLSVRRQAIIALGKIKDKSSILPLLDQIESLKESKDSKKDSTDLLNDIAQALRSIGSHQLVREILSHITVS
ncbi:MAG: HAMP domain-containing protein [Deltaproteobacteria bacterium]|nr:HAMP domain-containing protein [Deltaproteobacteria bacterium]